MERVGRGIEELAPAALVLCSTLRLALALRRRHDALQLARGRQRWPTLDSQTPELWLAQCLGEAQLAGEIEPLAHPLSEVEERLLWERAIVQGGAAEALFDRDGLARAAIQANALVERWRLRLAPAAGGEETRAFLRWRKEFRRLAAAVDGCDAASLAERQLDALAAGAGRLPPVVAVAGFDRYNPQELRLIAVLEARGVEVCELRLVAATPAAAVAHPMPDRLAECRAAAAWARERLAANPRARLGLVVPELSSLREPLEAVLDEALDPACLDPSLCEAARRYNFSLGPPLASRGIVATALRLLALAAAPRRLMQEEFSLLLRDPYWSASIDEADARARLDARLRQRLPLVTNLPQALRLTAREAARGLPLERLVADLTRLQELARAQPARQLPSAWATSLAQLLEAAAWPGGRALSSHEYQAQQAFFEILSGLAELDRVAGRVSMVEAQSRLAQLCRDRVFQPETEAEPALEVMGLLEALAAPLDGLWVMGMNAQLWPPSASPNPLLPAELQRQAASPGASGEVQSRFALAVHARLLCSARELHFSWARGEGDRQLRPSPLIAALPEVELAAAATLIETLAGSAVMESILDAQGPPLSAPEMRGGTALLGAQAVCPAWAYYRYRLGAKQLAQPVLGLSGGERGALVHRALERFWNGRASEELLALGHSARLEAVARAASESLQRFNAEREEGLSPRFLELEEERLRTLVAAWVEFELARPQPFRVIACESSSEVELEGLKLRVVVDRIDQLADGRSLIIDYKTGRAGRTASWGAERMAEPQLPIYAVLQQPPPAAVALARVRLDQCAFSGIAAQAGLLPKVAGIADAAARRLFPSDGDWQGLLDNWRRRLAVVAREFVAGEARVAFRAEAELAYCEVLPLLRLAERRRQLEEREPSP